LQALKFAPNLTTTDLADALGIDQTTATRSLALLRKSGLVIDTPGSDRRELMAKMFAPTTACVGSSAPPKGHPEVS
jgi:DNA-binding MarR family transcriptional regulator